MSELIFAALGFCAGLLLAVRLLRRHRSGSANLHRLVPEPERLAERLDPEPADSLEPEPATAAPHLISLFAEALRDPLRQLRRSEGRASEIVEQLERIAWQARMLVARPRPMQAKPASPVSLLQEAAEEVPLLRDGTVTVSWSLLNRQPLELDPERTRGALRELLAAGAAAAAAGGRIGIKILPGTESGYPVQIEVEIGQRGAETDSLSFLVARHLLEGQGARVEVDGNVTRIKLRNAACATDELAVA